MSGDRRAPESAPAPFDAMGSARRSGWHLSREVQVSHLIATITVAVSCLWYVAKLEQRIALLEQQASVQESNHARLLAELLGRAVDRAAVLADHADAARSAGQACERAYDSLAKDVTP